LLTASNGVKKRKKSASGSVSIKTEYQPHTSNNPSNHHIHHNLELDINGILSMIGKSEETTAHRPNPLKDLNTSNSSSGIDMSFDSGLQNHHATRTQFFGNNTNSNNMLYGNIGGMTTSDANAVNYGMVMQHMAHGLTSHHHQQHHQQQQQMHQTFQHSINDYAPPQFQQSLQTTHHQHFKSTQLLANGVGGYFGGHAGFLDHHQK
jgi:hypothetical protein